MSLHDLIILQNKCEELEAQLKLKQDDWIEACGEIDDLKQKLSDSEADWIKMRDIAEETQRKLDQAIEVLGSIAFMDEPDADKVEYWMNPDLNKLPQTLAFDTFLAREFLNLMEK